MSQLSAPWLDSLERRTADRINIKVPVPVRIARREGQLIDVGRGGARVRHSGALKLGVSVELSFTLGVSEFSCTARVVACRVAGLDRGGPTAYETSLMFSEEATRQIEAILGYQTAPA